MEKGFRPNGDAPSRPTQWSVISQTGTLTVDTTESKLFDIDCRGWDKMGIRVSALGLDVGDTITINIDSPEGATYSQISLTPSGTGSSQGASGITQDIIDIQTPKYVLNAYLTSGAGTTSSEVTVIVFLKAGNCD